MNHLLFHEKFFDLAMRKEITILLLRTNERVKIGYFLSIIAERGK